MQIRIITDEVRTVEGSADGCLRVEASTLPEAIGWILKPEGLCRQVAPGITDLCIPIDDPATLRPDARATDTATAATDTATAATDTGTDVTSDTVDLAKVAAALGRLCVVDQEAAIIALAFDTRLRHQALDGLRVPDVSLPDLDGAVHRLDEWQGTKRLLVTFSSWCGCRYDLPGWQALHDELSPAGFTAVGVAIDDAAADVVPWTEGITFPVLLDRQHVLSEVLAISNVPTVVWIDEDNRIVRPNGEAFGTDTFADFTGVAAGPHLDAVRRWVLEDELPLTPDQAAAAVPDLTDDEVLARLHFRVGAEALQLGMTEVAARHFDAAASLAPYDWTVRRAAMPLRGEDPFGQPFLDLYDEWQAAGRPYHGLRAMAAPRPGDA